MGNDGGSIPTRRELVKEAAKNPSAAQVKESQHEQQEYQWTTDPISRQPLEPPVVSDSSGKLYNKATILEYLVEGTRKEEAERETHGAVKSLKDIVEVKFELDSDDASADSSQDKDIKSIKKIACKCPVTGDRLGPGSKAVYIVPCGHAFSGAAIKEVSGERCLTCDAEYAPNDIIPINSVLDTDIARLSLRAKTLQEKGLSHSLKKASGSKKRKKRDEQVGGEAEEKGAAAAAKVKAPEDGKDKINNSATASLTAKVMHEQEKAKKRKMENENVKSLFSNRDQTAAMGNSAGFMTRGFSHVKR
jgi:hypothetical protein